jgi:hypothetical protein
MNRLAAVAALLSTALLGGCVFAPPINTQTDAAAVAKLSEQAVATCGAGNVREVNAKSFTCK